MLGFNRRKVYNFLMQRIKLVIEYNGQKFCGWQRQKSGRSVQGEIESALSKLLQQQTLIVGSSRTDAGVHAFGQVAHFDYEGNIKPENFSKALNSLLPDDIKIVSSSKVKNTFNARFDVKKKTYLYYLSRCEKNALFNGLVAGISYILDENKMKECLNLFLGRHNFKGFCASGAQVENFEREIYEAKLFKKNNFFVFKFTGNGFMQHMVRILVGTCVDVGRGKLNLEDVKEALKFGDRAKAGKTMPASGLYLKKIYY